MKTILPAIQAALKTINILSSQNDCYITPDTKFRPEGTGNISIGIHPAGITRTEELGEYIEIEASIDIVAFSPMTNNSDSITGTSGVYSILDAVSAILKNNSLNLSGFQGVSIEDDTRVDIQHAPTGETVQMLTSCTRRFTYTIERAII